MNHQLIIRHARQIVHVCKKAELMLKGSEMSHVAISEDEKGLSLIVGKDGNIIDFGADQDIANRYKDCVYDKEINADGKTIMPG